MQIIINPCILQGSTVLAIPKLPKPTDLESPETVEIDTRRKGPKTDTVNLANLQNPN